MKSDPGMHVSSGSNSSHSSPTYPLVNNLATNLLASAGKPPLVPLIKRRKLEHNPNPPSESNQDLGGEAQVIFNVPPPSTPAAVAALQEMTSVLAAAAGNQSHGLHTTNVTNTHSSHLMHNMVSTPITIRSASPNSLSIAKALSQLANSSTTSIQIKIDQSISTPVVEITRANSNNSFNGGVAGNNIMATPMVASNANKTSFEKLANSAGSNSLDEAGSAGVGMCIDTSGELSGENSANTSVELTDGDMNSESEAGHFKGDLLISPLISP
jgi:hypothetical protein